MLGARILAVVIMVCGCENRLPVRPLPVPDAQTIDDATTGDAAIPDARPASDAGTYDSAFLSFVAAQVYHDFPSLTQKSGSKFEVFLQPDIRPAQIVELRVFGPAGFVFDFNNEPFALNANGYILNEGLPTLWYQAFRLEMLADGVYTVRTSFENGEQEQFSRELRTNHALVDFYIEHADEMVYSPNSGVSPANDTVLSWTTLRDLGGPDAYYIGWISSGTTEAVTLETARGDSIFLAAFLDPRAGLNVSSSRKGSVQDPLPLGPQTWHPEITDSNRLDGVNVTIMTPAQHFTAE